MYKQILTQKQLELLPLIRSFSKECYLVGGTAIALQIGHRRSIDFDLFSKERIKRENLRNKIKENKFLIEGILHEDVNELTMIVNSVKMTFFNYPFEIIPQIDFEGIIKMPTLLDLSAMKAYALGRRAKWKDYCDLYFILKDHFCLEDVSKRSKEIFGNLFNEKLFREQLCYFEDIDCSEKIDFLWPEVSYDHIKELLTKNAIVPF